MDAAREIRDAENADGVPAAARGDRSAVADAAREIRDAANLNAALAR